MRTIHSKKPICGTPMLDTENIYKQGKLTTVNTV